MAAASEAFYRLYIREAQPRKLARP
jgi:hypothetical protein